MKNNLVSLVRIFCLLLVGLFVVDCATLLKPKSEVQVDYPVFKNDKRGRQLQQFLGDIKNIAFFVSSSESAKKNQAVQEYLEQVPSLVYEIFNREAYFKLIDISKRTDLLGEGKSLEKNKAQIGKDLGVQAFFYMTIGNPQITCKDKKSTTEAGKEKITGSNLSIMLSLDMTLTKAYNPDILKSVSSEVYKKTSNQSCEQVEQAAFFDAVKQAAEKLNEDLSPKVKTASIKIFNGSLDSEMNQLLADVTNELQGETPNYQSAFEMLEEANNKTQGKNWKVLANLGTCYYATRDYKKAVEFYGKAIKEVPIQTNKKDREYIRDLRKKVMVTFALK